MNILNFWWEQNELKRTKRNDRDFDCEFLDGWRVYADSFWIPAPLFLIDGNGSKVMHHSTIPAVMSRFCRPRLNKPQVLDDWSFIPDGFIWRHPDHSLKPLTSEQVREWSDWKIETVYEAFSCIGVEPDYAEWGKAHGIRVVE